MVIRTRYLKNPKRGTGIRYATFPISQAENISEKELQTALGINLREHCDEAIYSSETDNKPIPTGSEARWTPIPFHQSGDNAPHEQYDDTNINEIIKKTN